MSVVEGLAAVALGTYLVLGRRWPAFMVFGTPAKAYWRNWRNEVDPGTRFGINKLRFLGLILIVLGLGLLVTGRSI